MSQQKQCVTKQTTIASDGATATANGTSEDVITPRSLASRSASAREKISTFFQTFSAVFRPSVHFPPKAMGETVGTEQDCSKKAANEAASQNDALRPLFVAYSVEADRETGCQLIALFSALGSE